MKFILDITYSFRKLAGACIACIFFSSMAFSQNTYNLELQFSDLDEKIESTVFIAVYTVESTFLSDNLYKGFLVNTNGKTQFNHTISLPKGEYALSFFQDLNNDKKLDTNFIGYPTEPFAFSNNAPANFGPPKWKDALFLLDKNDKMAIEF